jgi:hypothetical protein
MQFHFIDDCFILRDKFYQIENQNLFNPICQIFNKNKKKIRIYINDNIF